MRDHLKVTYWGNWPVAIEPKFNWTHPSELKKNSHMIPKQDSADPAAETEYDPDSPHEQPVSALKSLIRRIENEMDLLQLSSFSPADALELGMLLVNLGTARKLPIAIDIRKNKHILFHVSLRGATPDNDLWITRKARTAERYAAPSLPVRLRSQLSCDSLEDAGWFDEARYALHGGAFPVSVIGAGQVATLTVSGLPQKADHELVVEALTLFRSESSVTASA